MNKQERDKLREFKDNYAKEKDIEGVNNWSEYFAWCKWNGLSESEIGYDDLIIKYNNQTSSVFEQKLKIGYEEYLKLPIEINRPNVSEIYSNSWCVLTGRACVSPHPHRYYTFLEFIYWCGKDETLRTRFIVDLPAKD